MGLMHVPQVKETDRVTGERIIFSGMSMYPFLRPGDLLIVRKPPWESLRIGDLVLIRPEDSSHLIVHRLVGWKGGGSSKSGICKGDNMIHCDSPLLTQGSYMGRVWIRNRKGDIKRLNGVCERIISLFTAFLSVHGLTPGILRSRSKRHLVPVISCLPGKGYVEEYILNKAGYFFFFAGSNNYRVKITFRGKMVGEVNFLACPLRVKSILVCSFFSLFINPEHMLSHIANNLSGHLNQMTS